MYCRNCGKEVSERAVVCVTCGVRPLDGNQFCSSCGAPTQAIQVMCVKCGAMLKGGIAAGGAGERITASDPPKDPVLMAVLSGCCLAGLGQIVLGQTVKGIVILVGSLCLGIVTMGVTTLVTWPLGSG